MEVGYRVEVGYKVGVGYRAVEFSLVSEVIDLACELSSWTPASLCGLWIMHLWVRNLVTLKLELHPGRSLLVTEKTAAGAPRLWLRCVWHSGESTVLSGGPSG